MRDPRELEYLRRMQQARAMAEEMLKMPCIPADPDEQIAELERICDL